MVLEMPLIHLLDRWLAPLLSTNWKNNQQNLAKQERITLHHRNSTFSSRGPIGNSCRVLPTHLSANPEFKQRFEADHGQL